MRKQTTEVITDSDRGPVAEGELLARRATTAMELYNDLLEDAGLGTENITSDDVKIPVLRVCQGQSPQRKKGNPKAIVDLNGNIAVSEPNMFNDLTKQVYGDGPMPFVVLKRIGETAVAFPNDKDSESPEEIVFDIPVKRIPGTKKYTDERLNFRSGDRKPIATKFDNFLVYLLNQQEVILLALKGSQLKAATQLNSLLKYPLSVEGQMITNPPAWARVFSIGTFMDKSGAGEDYSATSVNLVGIAPAEIRALAKKIFSSYTDVVIGEAVKRGAAEDAVTDAVDSEDVPF